MLESVTVTVVEPADAEVIAKVVPDMLALAIAGAWLSAMNEPKYPVSETPIDATSPVGWRSVTPDAQLPKPPSMLKDGVPN